MRPSLLALLVLSTPAWSQVTSRLSLGPGGVEGDASSNGPWLSADGRYVVFHSSATNLVPGDTNGAIDVFVRDRLQGTIERVSVDSLEAQGNGISAWAWISADGRFVAFESAATNLVAGDTNGAIDIFVRDRLSGTTERATVDSGGVQADQQSNWCSISADGRYVAFSSSATNLVAGDTNFNGDVFVHDRQAGTTVRASVDSLGVQGNNFSGSSAISADGRFVVFSSVATNLVAGDTNSSFDIFLHTLASGTTERVDVGPGGVQANFGAVYPSISADGRYVAFYGNASNLVAGDTNGWTDAFVRDRVLQVTELVSVATGGAQGDDQSGWTTISDDGRFVAFESRATNLVAGDTNGTRDVFLRDRLLGTTERVSVATGGTEGDSTSYHRAISADGRYVAYESASTNLVAGDTNGTWDVFVHDLDATGSTSLCDPGAGGVMACPCGNPPSGPGRGCDNSAGTGGAALAVSGLAYLSSDSLVFDATGELSSAPSVLWQGKLAATAGIVYGQGVRCTSGTLKRLYTKSASGGSLVAPDSGAGEPTVTARSAARGDPIGAGQSRWYFVGYRDPVVPGGCPGSSTVNATQTQLVTWSP